MDKVQLRVHPKTELKVQVVWIPKYRNRVRQSASERERELSTGKVASDHVHLFIPSKPHPAISTIVHWLKGSNAWLRLSVISLHRKDRMEANPAATSVLGSFLIRREFPLSIDLAAQQRVRQPSSVT